jgi:hypothetical protein
VIIKMLVLLLIRLPGKEQATLASLPCSFGDGSFGDGSAAEFSMQEK